MTDDAQIIDEMMEDERRREDSAFADLTGASRQPSHERPSDLDNPCDSCPDKEYCFTRDVPMCGTD